MDVGYLIDQYFIRKPRFRRFVTSLLERNRNVDVEIVGTALRINSRREHGYLRASRIVRRNATLREEVPVLMNLFAILRDGDTFVDIGANTGLFTHSVARLTKIYPNLKIIAIEPHPDTYQRLSVRSSERVTYLNLAVSDRAGDLVFIDGAVSHVFTAIDKKSSYSIPGEEIVVKGKRLDDLDLGSDSLVLKIDVEDQELRVLEGAAGLFAAGKVRAVYLDGYADASINDLLLGYGFHLYEGKSLNAVVGKTFSLLALKQACVGEALSR